MNANADMSPMIDPTRKPPVVYKLLLLFSMMSLIAGMLTGVMTYINVGNSNHFLVSWRNSFVSAFLVMPIGFILMGWVTKKLQQWLPNTSSLTRNIATGAVMACVMESLLALSTATTTVGFSDIALFFDGWLNGFLAALPMGLGLMVVFSLTIKPKVERFLAS